MDMGKDPKKLYSSTFNHISIPKKEPFLLIISASPRREGTGGARI
jgi:hypothetical protein